MLHVFVVINTSCSHWKAVLYWSELMKCNCSIQTWKPPCSTLHWEHALRQAVPGISKFTNVTLRIVSLGVFGVLMPPVPAGLVVILVCEMINESWNNKQDYHHIIIYCTYIITLINGPPHSPWVSCTSIPLSRLSATLNPTSWTWPTTESSKPWIPLL